MLRRGRMPLPAAVLVAGLTLGGLAACDGGGGRTSLTTTTSTSSGTTTSTTNTTTTSSTSTTSAYVPVKPEFPAEAKKHTDAGAVAFARFYWEALDYSWGKPDSSFLNGLTSASCEVCVRVQDSASALEKEGSSFRGPVMTVKRIEHVATSSDGVRIAADVLQLKNERLDANGTVAKALPEALLQRAMDIRWIGKWQVTLIGDL